MAAFGRTGRGSIFSKILVCLAVLIAGTIAGRMSIERPSGQTAIAARRNLTDAEKETIVSAIKQQMNDVTLTTVTWPPLILLSRAGITDYCGAVKTLERTLGFYAQLIFPQADPRNKLSRVSFTIIAMPDSPDGNYVVGTACLRYGYGSVAATTP
jgi:hypothetical protein